MYLLCHIVYTACAVCYTPFVKTREEAQKSAAMAASCVEGNLADRVRLVTTYVGDPALFHGTPVTA